MKLKLFYLLILLLFFRCKTSILFESNSKKHKTYSIVKNHIDLTKKQLKFIKKDDSLLYELNKSIEGKVVAKLLNKRLDSFFSKQYTRKELLVSLELDRGFPDGSFVFELDRKLDLKGYKNVKSGKEAKEYIESIERDMTNAIKNINTSNTIKKDSLN